MATVKPAIVNVMEGAARKAARALVRDFGEVEQLQVSRKGPADFVSAADLRCEETVRYELSRARPKFGWLMEEAGAIIGEDKDNRWIVDPLDGTTNFLHGVPQFAISIAHEQAGEIVAGIIYQPINDELFWSEKGGGAWLNNRRLRVSSREHLADSLIATGLPFKGSQRHPEYLKTLHAIIPEVAGIRRFGSAALDLAWVAAGRFDAFWEFGLSPWDVAAGLLLVREAGGMVSEVEGGSGMLGSGSILASNARLFEPFGNLLRNALAAY
ncbi:MAG: inositol monophosphatase family protein [Alphaproteobacteria bacterium]